MPSEEIDILRQASIKAMEDIRVEFRLQGHTLTGAAERSLSVEIEQAGGKTTAEITSVEYMADLDEYFSPSRLNFDIDYWNGIYRYVELRMKLRGMEATRATANIIRMHKATGRPTPGSYEYSQTGKRTEFIEDADEKRGRTVENLIDAGLNRMMDNYFTETDERI